MTKEVKKEFMKKLEKKLEEKDPTIRLLENKENPELFALQSFLPLDESETAFVFTEATLFKISERFDQLEIICVITNDVNDKNRDELKKAANALNFFSPVGSFGVNENRKTFYLRNCWPIDAKKEVDESVKDAEAYYDVMLDGIRGGYNGFEKIITAEMTYDEACSAGLLNKVE